MKTAGYMLAGIVGLALLIALAFAMELGGLKWKRYFAPKHENVRREVFKQTRSYNEAKVQDLAKYKLQYERASIEDKVAIKSAIRTMFADYDTELLPSGLSVFLTQVRGY